MLADPRAGALVPRRADQRGRSAEPARLLGVPVRTRRPRNDDPGLDALYGRGRALPRAGDPRRRPARRRGRAARARRADRRGRARDRDAGDPRRARRARGRGRTLERRAARHAPARADRSEGARSAGRSARGAVALRCQRRGRAGGGESRGRVRGRDHRARSRAVKLEALSRTLAIARKEVRQLRRDRLTFGMIVGLPVLQLLLFGYAIDQDVRHLRAGVADLAGTQRARMLVQDAQATQVIDIVETAQSAAELEALLRSGEISVGLLVPRDFERRVERGDRAPAQLLVDGSDPIVLSASRGILSLPVRARSLAPPAVAETFEVRPYYNPERRSQVHIVPGLLGVILTMTMVLFTAVAIVRERERGNL